MTEFIRSIQTDLFSRRLLPLLALLGVALAAAVGYAVTGGSSSSVAPAPTGGLNPGLADRGTALAVAAAPANPNQAVSETPAGTRYQNHGRVRDPFTPLPSPPAKGTSTAGGATSSSAKTPTSPSSSGSGASSGGTGTGEHKSPTPTPAPAKPSKPAKPPFPYVVSALFGLASTTPGQPATLTPYQGLVPGRALPSKKDVRISFERVTNAADGAVFKLVVPPILRGSARCLPSNSECLAIDLAVGQVEQLEYVEASGQVVSYELKLVGIAKKIAGASTATAKRR